jgi:hypothetical protein
MNILMLKLCKLVQHLILCTHLYDALLCVRLTAQQVGKDRYQELAMGGGQQDTAIALLRAAAQVLLMLTIYTTDISNSTCSHALQTVCCSTQLLTATAHATMLCKLFIVGHYC